MVASNRPRRGALSNARGFIGRRLESGQAMPGAEREHRRSTSERTVAHWTFLISTGRS